jgi:hypothetical protein
MATPLLPLAVAALLAAALMLRVHAASSSCVVTSTCGACASEYPNVMHMQGAASELRCSRSLPVTTCRFKLPLQMRPALGPLVAPVHMLGAHS